MVVLGRKLVLWHKAKYTHILQTKSEQVKGSAHMQRVQIRPTSFIETKDYIHH